MRDSTTLQSTVEDRLSVRRPAFHSVQLFEEQFEQHHAEERACECYEALQREYERLLPRRAAPPTACPPSFATSVSSSTRTVVTRRVSHNPSLLLCRI